MTVNDTAKCGNCEDIDPATCFVCRTPQPTQPLDVAPIKAREQAATPGPWSADGHEIYQGTPDDYTRHSLWIGETCNVDLPDNGNANGAFLAAARQDVPNLIREVERLRARIGELLQDSATLAALYAAGVDNWDGYDDALSNLD